MRLLWLLVLCILTQAFPGSSFSLCKARTKPFKGPCERDNRSSSSPRRCLGQKSPDVEAADLLSPVRLGDRTQYEKRSDSDEQSCEEVEYGGLHHCGVLVCDAELARRFYIDVFGFSDESFMRPTTLPYPGAFLKCGSSQIHLMQLSNPDADSSRPSYVGRDRHIAISLRSIDSLRRRLDRHGIEYSLSSSGRRALFCRDADQNGYEFVEVADP